MTSRAFGRVAPFAASLIVLAPAFAPAPAGAQEVPPFLASGQSWSTDERACGNPEEGVEGVFYVASKEGLFGYEFGCNFVDFRPVRNSDGETYGWLATASCGDDSGITRPDMFSLSEYDGMLTVTSQNDWNASLINTDPTEEDAQWSLVNREFNLCK